MENTEKKTVFISYSRSNKERISTLVCSLENEGLEVWWDIEIPPGQRYVDVIHRALKSADYIVVAWSKSSVKSEWVLREAEVGLDRKVLLPILLEKDVSLPFLFQDIHACNLIDWQGEKENLEYKNLIDAIDNKKSNTTFNNKIEKYDTTKKEKENIKIKKKTPNKNKNKNKTGTIILSLFFIVIIIITLENYTSKIKDEEKTKTVTSKKITHANSVKTKTADDERNVQKKSINMYTPRLVTAEPQLILRKNTSINSTGMDAVDYGTTILVGDKVSDKETINGKEGYWYRTKKKHGRNNLYVFDGYLAKYPIYKVIASSGLSIRKYPTTNSKKIGKMGKGDRIYSLRIEKNTVSIDGVNGKWHKIHTGDIEGYMFGAYLAKEN